VTGYAARSRLRHVETPAHAGTRPVIGKDGPVTTPPPPHPVVAGPTPGRYAGAPFASWGRRVLGYLIDIVILVVVIEIVRLVGGGLIVQAVVYFAGLALLGWMNGASGRTPGKRVVGIRVVRDADGRVLGGGLGLVRALCHFLDTVACFLGWLWPLWDSKSQTFADKILATVVIRA
jgi:uncharacterized RDD family membrane protein YckC